MAFQIVARNGGVFPSFRFPSLLDVGEEEFFTTPITDSGLSISEDDKRVYIEAAVPGIDSKDIEVTFEKGVLWIKGEAKEEEKKEEKKLKFYRKAQRAFSYRVLVPGDIDPNGVQEAVCKNGVMKVTFVKSPKTHPKKIVVKAA